MRRRKLATLPKRQIPNAAEREFLGLVVRIHRIPQVVIAIDPRWPRAARQRILLAERPGQSPVHVAQTLRIHALLELELQRVRPERRPRKIAVTDAAPR